MSTPNPNSHIRKQNSDDETTEFDIAIIGGGMAGSIAAYGFAEIGVSVALIESTEPGAVDSSSFDQRSVALSDSSITILRGLGLWEKIEDLACPINDIHISEKGQFGFARLNAKAQAVEALGQVIPLDGVGPRLWNEIRRQNKVSLICPAKVTDTKIAKSGSSLFIETNANKSLELKAKLILVADGTFSKIASQLDISVKRTPYEQVAVIANVMTDRQHECRAFERFTSSGPLALLPLLQNQLSLVWCQRPDAVEDLMALNDEDFLEQLQQAFGFRLGHFTRVSKRFSYPLASHWPQQNYKANFLLMGNAAHTLHPIAGQGINLGLRDIAYLIELISQSVLVGSAFNDEMFFKKFEEARSADWNLTHFATDSLARLFSNDFYPLTIARNKGLALFNRVPAIKAWLADAAMGYAGKNAKLARGFLISELSTQKDTKALQ